jgi:predicted metal-dependent phosphoesterase TrpH
MAHPGLTERDDIVEELALCGLDGLEIFHPVHNAADRKRYRKMAKRFGLFFSGGSDSHNRKGRYGDIGEEKVPFDYLQEIKTRCQRYA